MTASSAWGDDQEKFGAHRARLNLDRSPQGWTASVEDRSPWLQVNLKDPFIITRIATQGYGGNVDQWVEKYRMSWKTEEGVWRNYSVPHRVSSSAVNWKTKVITFFILKQYITLVSNIFIHIRWYQEVTSNAIVYSKRGMSKQTCCPAEGKKRELTSTSSIITQKICESEVWKCVQFIKCVCTLCLQIFHGNKDKTSVVSHSLGNPIKSSAVRFWPLTKHNFVSMRTELYGCLAGEWPRRRYSL